MRVSDDLTRAGRAIVLLSIAAGACCGGLLGCGASCDRTPDVEPTVYEDGLVDLDARFYETSPWEGPYLDFPAGRTYLLMHGLGARPRDVNTWLAFSQVPNGMAPGAGNQVQTEEVTDEFIRIRNDTCSDIFLRVTASNPEPSPTSPDAGP